MTVQGQSSGAVEILYPPPSVVFMRGSGVGSMVLVDLCIFMNRDCCRHVVKWHRCY